jgi:hypothetical protein
MCQEALTNLFLCLAALWPGEKQVIRANSHCWKEILKQKRALLKLICDLIFAYMGQEALTDLFPCLAAITPEMKELIRAISHC